MSIRRGVLWGLGLGACATVALSCGVDFGPTLLWDREQTLRAPVANSFAFEIAQIAGPVQDRLKAVENRDDNPAPGDGTDNDAIDVALYAQGAIRYHSAEPDEAKLFFEDVLALPPDQRSRKATSAAYMIGRIAALAGDNDQAVAAFAMTRALAIAGQADPEGLAVASYGEEARLHFRRAKELLEDGRLPDANAANYAREISAAIGLYANQVARGSSSGWASLRIVAQHILQSQSTIAAAALESNARRLMVAFLLARFWEPIPDDDQTGIAARAVYSPLDVAREILAAANEQNGAGWLEYADRLAALAYREGNYALARRFVQGAGGPLAAWIKAKLAVQEGDVTAAAVFYAEAAQAFPVVAASSFDPANRALFAGESGILSLARGDYLAAFHALLRAGAEYWNDISYVAERVLTIDELKSYLDTKSPDAMTSEEQPTVTEKLRDLLARRLMRNERFREALPYFIDDDVRRSAATYADLVGAARTRWSPIGRAEAWYKAAVLARHSGLEMMGSEGYPDYFVWRGNFHINAGPLGSPSLPVETEPAETAAESSGALQIDLVNEGERQRFAASTIVPDHRFHYRYIAVDEATKAADLLPPRSQAFAAVLCYATSWMFSSGKDAAASELYWRYVSEGPFVPWADHFGRDCPEPEFDRVAGSEIRRFYLASRHYVSVQRWLFAAGFAALAIGLFGMLLRRRRPQAR